MKVIIVVGSPRPYSRTRRIAEKFTERMLGKVEDLEVIDLSSHLHTVFDETSVKLQDMESRVVQSELVILASPTYKATFTGLLKAFLDNYEADGLEGVLVVPLMKGADRIHTLGLAVHLIPLLLELGAVVPDRGHYFIVRKADDLVAEIQRAADRTNKHIEHLAGISNALGSV